MKSAKILKREEPTFFQAGLNGLLIAFPFMDIFLFRYTFTLFPGPLGYGPLICMYVLLPFWVVRYAFPKKLLMTLLGIGVLGSSGVLLGWVERMEFVKILGGVVLSSTYYWYLWQYLALDFRRGFQLYVNGCVIVSALGLLIFVDSIFPFGVYSVLSSVANLGHLETKFGIRLASTFGEPSYFATTVAPASLFAMQALFFGVDEQSASKVVTVSKFSAVLILAALLLTLSSIAYIGVFMATLALLHRTRKIKSIIVGTAAICLLGWAATRSDEVVSRVKSPIFRENASLDEMHGSSLILYNHAHIAWENVSSHPMFGTGLGSHPIATERFSILRGGKLDPISLKNAKDASSMLLRILSEFGFCGLVALSTFIWACRPSTRANHVRDIAVCCLIAIALQLFRQGNFVLHGFPFFVLTLALLPRLSPKNVQE